MQVSEQPTLAPGSVRDAEQPESLVDLLASSVRAHGNRALFLTKRDAGWFVTTYREFAELAETLRRALSMLGVGRGDAVGIIAGNSVEWAVCAYATYGSGAAFVPLYESQHEKEWLFIVRDSGMKVLFVANDAVRNRVERGRSGAPSLQHIVVLSDTADAPSYAALLRRGASVDDAPVSRPTGSDRAALLYTSGTTGEPKGVVLSHENVVTNVLAVRDLVAAAEERPEEQRTLAFLPWAHAFGHTVELHAAVAAGSCLALAESVEAILDNLREVKPTALVAVPKVFSRIYTGAVATISKKPAPVRWLFRRGLELSAAKQRGERLRRLDALVLRLAGALVFAQIRKRLGRELRYAVSGAAALSREVAEFVDALGIVVYEGYGLTETSPVVATNVPGRRKLGSVGLPLPGVRVVVDRSVTGDSVQGEIVVYGPNVMRGYHNRERETALAFTPDGGFRTGDMGYLDEDGYLFITGRLKEQYKLSNGKYVVPSPLEERLRLSPFIANVLVYGENKPYNVALIVPEQAVLEQWAEAAGLGGGNLEKLVREPAVHGKLREEIERLSTEFKGYERVKAFSLLTEDFTQENELLTPSLKLKRHKVVERFRRELLRL